MLGFQKAQYQPSRKKVVVTRKTQQRGSLCAKDTTQATIKWGPGTNYLTFVPHMPFLTNLIVKLMLLKAQNIRFLPPEVTCNKTDFDYVMIYYAVNAHVILALYTARVVVWVVRLRSGHIDDYIGVVSIISRVSRIPLLNPRLSRKNRGTVASKRYHTRRVLLVY